MNTKKKIIVSFASLCLVAGIIVIGVFAALSQTFQVTGRISFVGRNVTAQVAAYYTKDADVVDFATAQNSQKYSISNSAFGDSGINATTDKTAYSSDLSSSSSVTMNLDFNPSSGNTPPVIKVYAVIKNNGSDPFSVTMTAGTNKDIENIENVTTVVNDAISGTYGYTNSILVLDAGAMLKREFVLTVNNEGLDVQATYEMSFELNYVSSYTVYTPPTVTKSFLSSTWKETVTDSASISETDIEGVYTTDEQPSTYTTSVNVGSASGTSDNIVSQATSDGTGTVTAYVASTTTTPSSINTTDNAQQAITLDGTKYNVYLYSPVTIKAPTNSKNLFAGLSGLTEISFDNFNTTSTTNMSGMFNGCSSLATLDLSSIDMTNCTSTTSTTNMLTGMTALTDITAPANLTVSIALPTTMYVEESTTGLTALTSSNSTVELKNQSGWVNPYAFLSKNWGSLVSSSVGGSYTNIKEIHFVDKLPANTTTSIDVGTSGETSTTVITTLTGRNEPIKAYISTNATDSTKYDINFYSSGTIYAPQTSSSLFSSLTNLTSLTFDNFDTSKVTNMYDMFDECSSLTSLDVSDFNTSKVTNMRNMFCKCLALTSLDLSNFDTSAVTDMYYMFSNCSSLINLDLINFNTSKVTNMYYMFINCSSLTSLDVSSFNTSIVTDMYYMFSGCSSLTSLDVSSFNTSKLTSMQGMFNNCSSLTSLDVSDFDTSNVTSMNGMFWGCSVLTSLDLSSFNMTKCSYVSSMLSGMYALTTLVTPTNVQVAIDLPKIMYTQGSSTVSTSIPVGTSSYTLKSTTWS